SPDGTRVVTPSDNGSTMLWPAAGGVVPAVEGLLQADAQALVSGSGLVTGEVAGECSDTVPAGAVIRQNPAAGSVVGAGSAVDLAVSTGGCPVAVPNLAGLPLSAAQALLTASGLVSGSITQQCSDDVFPGDVVSQDPAAESVVTGGAVVDLTVSEGFCAQAPFAVEIFGVSRVGEGGTLTLRAVVSGGSGAVRYLWRRNGLSVDGEEGPVLSIPDVSGYHAGTYVVMVSDGAKAATMSPPFQVTVLPEGSLPAAGAGGLAGLAAVLAVLMRRRLQQ
ncbi:MAG TPA: PASTA domain-containing protein, partial [Candidatus Hydrogenedentes bacterium]|nr:PASTA domain-containing protein [Candidatus Hydrogenedentota bacterium]